MTKIKSTKYEKHQCSYCESVYMHYEDAEGCVEKCEKELNCQHEEIFSFCYNMGPTMSVGKKCRTCEQIMESYEITGSDYNDLVEWARNRNKS